MGLCVTGKAPAAGYAGLGLRSAAQRGKKVDIGRIHVQRSFTEMLYMASYADKGQGVMGMCPKLGMLTKCVYFLRSAYKKARKKTPRGVTPGTLSFFLSLGRSRKGGSGPPLPLSLVVRRVPGCASTSARQKYLRNRSAELERLPYSGFHCLEKCR